MTLNTKNHKLKFEPVQFRLGTLLLIDQRKLPLRFLAIRCKTIEDAWRAIKHMVVRGAPAIGVAAAYGAYLGIMKKKFKSTKDLLRELKRGCDYLKTARPTAVNLAWAVERILKSAQKFKTNSVAELKHFILKTAETIHLEDIELCFSIGRYGARLIRNGEKILTHCNAGGLATTGFGTALSPLFHAKSKGKRFSVWVDETRPFLQGARLTYWELQKYKIPATLICDNMAASLMKKGLVSKVIVGADRIVRNGDTANKIGTYGVACLAKIHKIPFYVAAPSSTFDFSKKYGKLIPIEERHAEEITHISGTRIAPMGARVHNPAFDVTPHELIAGFITDKGILRPPFTKSFAVIARTARSTQPKQSRGRQIASPLRGSQ